ncbi:hypothetical protein BY996DRAFT_7617505 [Phakopsora pachyrhizi]|uniref:DNA primase n=1 Tax=Phakopsora pachyrhizi TaxID=170000 RepID=A0AAV0BAX3_PHAPC|nr:hypothetical protein BY996DRAFT_7617505 [Phakopsora pachyrhizi]CAH7683408.1 hypothetical protein PPACK8108_LOCUS16898 [Phakopsora pachyrhizi]
MEDGPSRIDGEIGEQEKNELAKVLFEDDSMEMDNDDAPLDIQACRMLSKFDDPWENLKDPHVMINFYKNIFPWKLLFLWLNQDHAPNYHFANREFAVTLQNDAYLRYNSYSNYLDLQKDMIRLNPSRFEIGAVYSVPPRDKKSIPKSAFRPILRELVFDIDLTDYDDIRRCCNDKKICRKCWKFISIAVKVLEKRLRTDFGFRQLLWVYSGRRGIHCWISDEEALKLSDDQRRCIVNYLDIFRGGGQASRSSLRVDFKGSSIHSSIKDSVEIAKPWFEEVALKDQDVFKGEDGWKFFKSLWDGLEFQSKLSKFDDSPSIKQWEDVINQESKLSRSTNSITNAIPNPKLSKQLNQINDIKRNIILHYTYPRIDLEVSKHMNHLLKSPFCVHPGTGKVCIPVDPEKVQEFDPESVPDVRDLLRELDRQKTKSQNANPVEESNKENSNLDGGESGIDDLTKAWSKTSLKPYVEYFEKHVTDIIKHKMKMKKDSQNQTNSMEF